MPPNGTFPQSSALATEHSPTLGTRLPCETETDFSFGARATRSNVARGKRSESLGCLAGYTRQHPTALAPGLALFDGLLRPGIETCERVTPYTMYNLVTIETIGQTNTRLGSLCSCTSELLRQPAKMLEGYLRWNRLKPFTRDADVFIENMTSSK